MPRPRKMKYPAALGDPKDIEDEAFPGYAKLLWLDPGGTTGWAIMVVHPDALEIGGVSILQNLELTRWGAIPGAGMGDESEQLAISRVLDTIQSWPGCAYGTESFRLRQFTKDSELLTPVRVQAAVKYALWAGEWGPLWEQQPALAKSTAPDARLKEWGLYDTHSGPHARDAVRHAITFLRRCKEREALRRMAWPHLYDPAVIGELGGGLGFTG